MIERKFSWLSETFVTLENWIYSPSSWNLKFDKWSRKFLSSKLGHVSAWIRASGYFSRIFSIEYFLLFRAPKFPSKRKSPDLSSWLMFATFFKFESWGRLSSLRRVELSIILSLLGKMTSFMLSLKLSTKTSLGGVYGSLYLSSSSLLPKNCSGVWNQGSQNRNTVTSLMKAQ